MTDIGLPDRLMKIAYLYLEQRRSEAEVKAILYERGATKEEAKGAMLEAHRRLNEVAAYRNKGWLKLLMVGAAIILIGLFLLPASENAAPRFQLYPYMTMLLGASTIGFALWSRSLPR